MMQPMPRVPPVDWPAMYDDLVKLPDNLVAEILDGELHASPKPAPPHVVAGSSLGFALGGPYFQGRGGPGGWWIDEPELHLGADVLVPDVAGWRKTRMPHRPETAYLPAPDWVCEILSPSTGRHRPREEAGYDAGRAWPTPGSSTRRCERSGCASRTGSGSLVGTHVDDEVVRAEPFVELASNFACCGQSLRTRPRSRPCPPCTPPRPRSRRREIARRMGTSAAQVCPLFDQTNTRKSVDEVLRLLEREVQFSVRAKRVDAAAPATSRASWGPGGR